MTDPQWQKRQEDFFDANLPPPSTAGHFQWSEAKLRELRPEFFGASGMFYTLAVALRQQFNDRQFIKECLDGGDCRAAVVMSVSPLLVAAYSDELDCIAMLKFPDSFVPKYQLKVGTKLLTVNNYGAGSGATDIVPGPKNTGNWDNMIPTIAEFATDDLAQINQIKQKIPADEWQRCAAMGQQYLKFRPNVWRDGRPFLAGMPLAGAQEYERNLQRAQRFRMLLPAIGGGLLLLLIMCGGIVYFALDRANNPRMPQRGPGPQPFAMPGPPMPGPPQPADGSPTLAVGAKVEVQMFGDWQPGEVLEVLAGGNMVRVRVQPNRPGMPPSLEHVLPRQMVRTK